MYCGWNGDSGGDQPQAQPSGGEFQQGVILWRFAILSAVLVPIAYTQLHREGPVHPTQWAVALACVVLGPIAFALQLWRRHQGRVEIEEDGLRFESGERLAFRQIESITLYTGLPTDISERVGEFAIGKSGLARILRVLFMGKIGVCVIAGPLMVISYFLVPAIGLLTPFHSRIVLFQSNGNRRVLHDLDEFWALYLAINSKLRRKPVALRRAA